MSKAEVAKRCLPGRMSAKARPQSIMWSDRLTAEVTCITAASIRVPWPYGRFSRASKAGRTRPPVVGGWPGPVLSSFVKANLESGTNFLRPDIRVGRLVASVGDPSLEMSLPFGRRDLQLFPSCSASVVGIDADGGSPDGDFTTECGGRVAARWCPDGLFAAVAGAVSDLICKAGNELRPLRQVLAPNVMIMKR